jgi:hypothetical protein
MPRSYGAIPAAAIMPPSARAAPAVDARPAGMLQPQPQHSAARSKLAAIRGDSAAIL